MLALTRSVGESFTIGDDITIHVVAVYSSGRVRLGIDAPRDLAITRDDAKHREAGSPRGDDTLIRNPFRNPFREWGN